MEFIAGMANNLKIVDTALMFKFVTMLINCRGIISIVCEWFVREERNSHVFVRADLKMSFCLTYVGTIACTAREFIYFSPRPQSRKIV